MRPSCVQFQFQVKTEGDAFMIVFTRPADAVLFGTDLQIDLLEFPWPDWMLEDEVRYIISCSTHYLHKFTQLV